MSLAMIPLSERVRACVTPSGPWMLPFVVPGVLTDNPVALDQTESPIITTVNEVVEWWWRWRELTVTLTGLGYDFGNQEIVCRRVIAPATNIYPSEMDLAKKESHDFYGSDIFEINHEGPPPFTDTLGVTVHIKIMPPKDTSYGDEFTDPGWPKLSPEAYQIQRGFPPSVGLCVPIILITVTMSLSAGPEVVNYLTNYGPSDSNWVGTFGAHGITLGLYEAGTSVVLPSFSFGIQPTKWYSWQGTWDTLTGARN